MLLTVVFLLVGALVVASYWPLARNYKTARSIGLSKIVLPWSPENPLGMLLAPLFMPLVRRMPVVANTDIARFGQVGWEFKYRSRVHRELGDCFTIVTPGKNWIYVCNADTVEHILAAERRQEVDRPVELLAMLDVYGPNLSTHQGEDWQRMRKCTAAVFNHKCMQLAWSAALEQGMQALTHWQSLGTRGVYSTAQDLRAIALHVLLRAAFNVHHDFQPSKAAAAEQGEMTERDALGIILENAILILAVGPKHLAKFTFPRFMKRIGQATRTFERHMAEQFEAERERVARGETNQGNLMATLVHASLEQELLTRQEVFGNIFLYNFSGHDTTAHSSLHTILLLAAHPEVQQWVRQEITHVLPSDNPSTWDYDSAFPRLNRTLAVLLETVRLYEPLLSVLKVVTSPQGLHLKSNEQNIFVPTGTRLVLNVNAFQTDARYWGEDGEQWRPSRWIAATGPGIAAESIVEPIQGSYLPWGGGVRACPGKRFAHAEHVALMVALLRNHAVEPRLLPGEDDATARRRVIHVANDSGMKLLHQVLHPERAPLVWKRL